MDVLMVKSDVVGKGRRRSDGGGDDAVRCVKRRRREPALPPIAIEGNGELVDQSATGTIIKRSSRFRGVSRHRWTGRFEAHLWDKGSWNATQRKKGKQVYLGAYDEEESAARAYDLAALKYWGPTTFTNFPVSDYDKEIHIMQCVTKEEYLASLRRKSSGFSRGVSKYRGVARHHHNGRWEARIGRVFGNKYLYLGTYSTQEEAAHAYDIAAIEYRGINAVTNFDLSTYIRWLRPIPANHLTTPQDQQSNVHPRASTNFLNSAGSSDPLSRHVNPFVADSIDNSPCKQEFAPRPISESGFCAKSSSPTALGLLLRSSMFKQLVEKNSVGGMEEEMNGDVGLKDSRQQMGSGEEMIHGIFYGGIVNAPTYVCASNGGDGASRIELQESSGSYYNGHEQTVWNYELPSDPVVQ